MGVSNLSKLITVQAIGLPNGSTMRGECPACGKRELTITRKGANLAFKCHRASCGIHGYTRTGGIFEETTTKKSTKEVPEVSSTKLPEDVAQWLTQRYCLEPETIQDEGLLWWPERGRVLSPIYDPSGRRYGYAGRLIVSPGTGPKSLTVVQDTSWRGGLFTRTGADSTVLIVVEDPFSAYAAAEYGYRGMALLGVHLPESAEEFLLQYEEIVIALDADATDKAARLVQRLSYLNVRQLVLEKDIKDMDMYERSSVLGVQ